MSLPSADPQAGHVGHFFDKEEAIGPEAGEASGESLGADGVEPQLQEPPHPKYDPTTLPDIDNPARLPGIFLFLTLQHTDKTWVQAVAYDPYAKAGDRGVMWHYRQKGLPYYEHFSEPSTTKTEWEMGPENYIGKYGGPENPHRAAAPHDWPYAKTNSSIANGINIAFWAKDNTLRGLFASPPHSLFNKKSAYLVMPLKDGQRKNFLREGDATHKYLESAQIDFYATWNDS